MIPLPLGLTLVFSLAMPVDDPPPVSWETLPARMAWEANNGFAGVVLVVRDGSIVFHEAYGLANREKKIPMRPDTILGIGSTPIDFTKVSILRLAEEGRLSLSDPITKFFEGVPEDKRAMTLDHLMTGRSGLEDFHDVPTDRDPDHSWIDRDEAVRRILGGKLLFPPGTSRRHSHSGYGLLAAVVEIASGKSFAEFTREKIYEPAGMTDTRFFGEPYPEDRMAIGYGPRKDGEINAPPYWGKTSWLVMGSGGQVSTAMDMVRFNRAIHGGLLLSPESVRRFVGPESQMLVGGDAYGFEIMYTAGARSFMIVMGNAGSPATIPGLRRLGRDLAALVSGTPPAKFALGIEFEAEDGGRTIVRTVVPGGAAARDGLRAGDLLLSANGKPLGPDPAAVFQALLRTGDPIAFEIERGGERAKVTVTPQPR